MTGQQAWAMVAPLIPAPAYVQGGAQTEAFADAYTTLFIGALLYDNWVANGKPEEWKNPKGGKK